MNEQNESHFELIRQWAEERGLYKGGDTLTQFAKLSEEQGELARALIKGNLPDAVDAIGDMVVVLTNLSELLNKQFDNPPGYINIETCIASAWDEIKNRKGKMINGTFVKNNEE